MNGMPVRRDVRVQKADGNASCTSVPGTHGAKGSEPSKLSGFVTVMGFDSKDVLFSSDQVGTVQWRDSKGDIVALLVRLKPDIWGFSRRGEDDWEQVLERYGHPDIS